MDAVKNVARATADAEQHLESRLTVLWHEIQPWQQDNHYIRSGYRPMSNSYFGSIKSLLYIHNETVNVYTHLLGAIAAAIGSFLLYSALKPRYEAANQEDILMFGCFFVGAALCLGMSATYHLLSNHSPRVARMGNKLDYLGIVCLIWGSFIPSVYYGLLEHPSHVKFYWIMVSNSAIPASRR